MTTMFLHEEYIKRHNINIPVVLRVHRSCVFLKSKTSSMGRILTLSWRNSTRHPGYFEMNYFNVLHNGCEDDTLIHPIRFEDWKWPEYEFEILKMVEEIKQDYIAVNSQEVFLAAWFAFLIMCDSWLAKHMNPHFFTLVEASIQSNNDSQSRKIVAIEAIQQLPEKSYARDVWHMMMLPLATCESKWLIGLING